MFTARWDKDSVAWISDLKRFADLLLPGARGACARVAQHTVNRARVDMPVFEGTLRNDFRVLSMKTKRGRTLTGFSVGFTSATVMPEIESAGGPKPFAIGLGKHAPGAQAHRVMLYNPSTGGSTPGRAKLIRYLKSVNSARYGDLPDNADKEDVDEWRRGHGRPYVWVSPQSSASDFLWNLIENDGDPLMEELAEQVWNAVARVWTK